MKELAINFAFGFAWLSGIAAIAGLCYFLGNYHPWVLGTLGVICVSTAVGAVWRNNY